MSQPKSHSPTDSSASGGSSPRCSIVQYEMQRRASSSRGATIAPVGHASMQRVHVPQWSTPGGIRLELRADQELAQEQERAQPLVEEERVLAAPAEARTLRPPALHDGARVGERATVERRVERAPALEESVELVLEHAVVVLAPGVPGDLRPRRLGGVAIGAIVDEAHRDDGAAPLDQEPRVDALLTPALHPAHRPVPAAGQPLREQIGFADGFGARHADQVESQVQRLGLDPAGELGGGHPVPLSTGCASSGEPSAAFTRSASAVEKPGTLAISPTGVLRILSTDRK